MKTEEILEIKGIIEGIQVKNEKLNSLNAIIQDKLESIQTFKNEETAFMLYNAKRNIEHYVILNYLEADKIAEINKDLSNMMEKIKKLENAK